MGRQVVGWRVAGLSLVSLAVGFVGCSRPLADSGRPPPELTDGSSGRDGAPGAGPTPGTSSSQDAATSSEACGGSNEPCCPGNTCAPGACCSANGSLPPRCVPEGQNCLILDTVNGGVCRGGVCQCGLEGAPCCESPATACASPTDACSLAGGGTCLPCGTPGNPCCPGDICADGGCCIYVGSQAQPETESGSPVALTECYEAGATCPTSPASTCAAGSCGDCGGYYQPCCVLDGVSVCTAPDTFCLSGPSGSRCESCGTASHTCCVGYAPPCNAGLTCWQTARADTVCQP
jgi:hypothetical protein